MSKIRVLPALIVLALTMASGNIMLGLFSTVQEAAKAEMALSDFQLSLLHDLTLLSVLAGFLFENANCRMPIIRVFLH